MVSAHTSPPLSKKRCGRRKNYEEGGGKRKKRLLHFLSSNEGDRGKGRGGREESRTSFTILLRKGEKTKRGSVFYLYK